MFASHEGAPVRRLKEIAALEGDRTGSRAHGEFAVRFIDNDLEVRFKAPAEELVVLGEGRPHAHWPRRGLPRLANDLPEPAGELLNVGHVGKDPSHRPVDRPTGSGL